jgi:hypothetical protein
MRYRILMGVPWPREPMARAGVYPAAAALGAVFDATTAAPARLPVRRMASAWLLWSESQLRDTLDIRRGYHCSPMEARPDPPAAFAPTVVELLMCSLWRLYAPAGAQRLAL